MSSTPDNSETNRPERGSEHDADPLAFLPLKPEIFEILLALGHSDAHGYGIVKAVEDSSAGAIRLAPSLLYRRLKRLMELGVVAEADERPVAQLDDQRRRYYRLTELGQRVLRAEARRLTGLARDRRVRRLAGEPE